MPRQVIKYTKEFKQEAVNLALKSASMSRTARELGIPVGTHHSWVEQLKLADKTKINPKHKSAHQDIAALLAENRRLNKELKKGSAVLCAAPRVKYTFIKGHQDLFNIN